MSERREARDAKVWEPSTFASRKAHSRPRPDPPLVSMGTVEHRMPGSGRNARGQIITGELLVRLGRNGESYLKLANGQLMDVSHTVEHDESVEPLGVVRTGTVRDRHAPSDPPPRRVT